MKSVDSLRLFSRLLAFVVVLGMVKLFFYVFSKGFVGSTRIIIVASLIRAMNC